MNMQNQTVNVKPELPKTVGPWRNQREAANHAKEDLLCKAHGYFHVLKNSGSYSYVTGSAPLFSIDRIVATYYYLAGRVWSHPRIVNYQNSQILTGAK